MTRWPGLAALCFAFVNAGAPSHGADANAVLAAWLAVQTNLVTWQAQFTQTRALSTLTQPLTARGRVWFAAPDRFRWELGEPPQTIAVRQPDQVLILYPRLKRAERYPLDAGAAGPWKDAMALLDAGFPRSRAEVESRFNILSLVEVGGGHQLTMQPRSASARRLMPEIQLTFATKDGAMLATQMKFADGSTMRNDFTNVVVNPKLDEASFNPTLGADYQVTQPAAKGVKR
ncbi:MAG TPA: outer membrane lipoprotein carrier protein LolA [Verrucomicrobiae bacterium]|jgi:outer membrane lipoprotein-sorting protein